MIYILILAMLVFTISSIWHLTGVLQFLQLEEYNNIRFLQWSLKNWRRIIWPIELLALLAIGLYIFLDGIIASLFFAILWGLLLTVTVQKGRKERSSAIKPLVYTARVKRLLGCGLVIAAFEIFVVHNVMMGFWLSLSPIFLAVYISALLLLSQLAFLNVVLANILCFPIEELFRQYYVWSAKQKISAINPTVIGITGSYGKTTTKEILFHLLSTKFSTLKTPKSYNTLMGICKVVRENLEAHHTHFVVELGAYKPGEIARICKLIKPRVGLITAVGPQHLERFKTIDNVAKAKNELIEALPADGVAIFNYDDPICRELSGKAKQRVKRYGLQSSNVGLDLSAQNIEVNNRGTAFDLIDQHQNRCSVQTLLLGRHNVSNILAATLVALEFDIPMRKIISTLPTLPPVEHRLQLIKGANNITVLDNAYNSNPLGASISLEVLNTFETGQRFLVTPGFIELGNIENEENYNLGRKAADVCDYVFLIGRPDSVKYIARGLQDADFNPEKIFFFGNLNQARIKLNEMVKSGDTILFENDLPDTYI